MMFLKFSAQRTERPYTAPKIEALGKPLDSSFESFMAAIRSRMHKGKEEYKDRSFSEHPARLVVEIMEEAQDIAGWAYILHVRLEKLKSELEKLEVKE